MADNALDQYIQRLQNIEPFDIYAVKADGTVAPWYTVTGDIVRDVVIREDSLAAQVEAVSAQVLHWGRHAALAKRVWEIEEREYRVWKAQRYLEAVKGAEKKPTEAVIEATYRTHPEYSIKAARVERAEEAFNAATAVLEAFKAKRDMMKAAVSRSHEAGQPRLTV